MLGWSSVPYWDYQWDPAGFMVDGWLSWATPDQLRYTVFDCFTLKGWQLTRVDPLGDCEPPDGGPSCPDVWLPIGQGRGIKVFSFPASSGFVADLSVTNLQGLTRTPLTVRDRMVAKNWNSTGIQTERSVSHPMIRINRKSQGSWACSWVAGGQKKAALGHHFQLGRGWTLWTAWDPEWTQWSSKCTVLAVELLLGFLPTCNPFLMEPLFLWGGDFSHPTGCSHMEDTFQGMCPQTSPHLLWACKQQHSLSENHSFCWSLPRCVYNL